MSRLRIVVEVEDRIDPTLNDPMEVADTIVEEYLAFQRANPHYPWIELEDAEWR